MVSVYHLQILFCCTSFDGPMHVSISTHRVMLYCTGALVSWFGRFYLGGLSQVEFMVPPFQGQVSNLFFLVLDAHANYHCLKDVEFLVLSGTSTCCPGV